MYYQQAPPIAVVAAPVYGSPIGALGEYPMQCTCSRCGKQIVTRVEKSVGLLAWLICLGLFFIGFWPCYLIPFCVDACKVSRNFVHFGSIELCFVLGHRTLLSCL